MPPPTAQGTTAIRGRKSVLSSAESGHAIYPSHQRSGRGCDERELRNQREDAQRIKPDVEEGDEIRD